MTAPAPIRSVRRIAADLWALTKPRIAAMVIVATAVGFVVSPAAFDAGALAAAALGVYLVAASSSVLNQVLEIDEDRRMRRTCRRPLPDGRLSRAEGAWFGAGLAAAGVALLLARTNLLTASLAAATLLAYLFVYTPLKKRSTLNTIVGAVPGAMPPVLGWTAATGAIEAGALALFAILFLWQLPHFLSIAWLHRDDYQRGGFRMLPLYDEAGTATARQMVLHCGVLGLAALLPAQIGLAGTAYSIGACVLSAGFLAAALWFAKRRDRQIARLVMGVSLVYLPALLGLLVLGG